MTRYFLNLRYFKGELYQDEEGYEFPSIAAARDHALRDMRELVADAIKSGDTVEIEAIVVADGNGRHVASVPIVAAVPPTVITALKDPTKIVAPNRLEEYRLNAEGCRRMAESADDPDDKRSWLHLADAWLQLLPKHQPSRHAPGWPKPSDEDSTASH